MNPYSQPNMHVLNGKESKDFYGSGDVDNNGTISFEDAQLIRNGTETGNDRADVNGDEIIDNIDATMIENYVNGTLSYLPSEWNHLNRTERIDWLTKMLEIDKTDERQYIPGEYMCGSFGTEHLINFFGVENLEDWLHYDKYAEDGDDNARFNIPIYGASTRVTTGVSPEGTTETSGHYINAVLVGPESGERYEEDPTNFNHWYFFEPQADFPVQPGDWSMNKDEYAEISWFGYSPSMDLFATTYLINFDLENGDAVSFTKNPYLLSTNPNLDTEAPTADFPADKQVPFTQGMDLVSIIEATPPTNVSDNLDPSPVVSYDYTSEQTSDGTCSDVSYDLAVNWNIVDNAANDTNYVQTVSVRDLEAPTFTSPMDITVKEHEGTDPSLTGELTALYDNSNLEIQTSYSDTIDSESALERVLKRTWTATDVCGNGSSEDQYITVELPDAIEDLLDDDCGLDKIYPVPIQDKATFQYSTPTPQDVKFSVINMNGQVVDKFKMYSNTGENSFQYSFKNKNISAGMYIIIMSSKSCSSTKRVQIK